MKPAILLLAFAALGACSKKHADAPAADAKPASPAALDIAPLAYEQRTLDNGLKVYALRDAAAATVAVHVWYDVGSKDDPAGRSGFAHLFEHILFKSTRNMPNEMLDRLTEDVGGFNNASTYDDFTNYYEVVPANHLERILWAEAERMGSLVINEAVFRSERDVVKEELRQRVLADPYGRLFGLYIPYANYAIHPYGRPGIGSLEDLDAATVDDVRQFHATYYRPDNAVLVVAGNFEPAALTSMVDKYFGPIKRPARAIPRVEAIEPERTAGKTYTVYAPTAPLPAAVVSWPSIPAAHPDQATLAVLDAVLSRGESSRLYQSVVYDKEIAVDAQSLTEATEAPGLISMYAILSEGRTAEEGSAALIAEAARLAREAPSAAELEEAKNELVTARLVDRETPFGRASELAESVIRYGSPDASSRLLREVQAVTPGDVQRLAASLFRDDRRVVIHYAPQSAQTADKPGDALAQSPTIAARTLAVPAEEIPVTTLAEPADRIAPPAPGPAIRASVPAIAERRLDNGMRVLVAQKRDLPLIAARLVVAGGASSEPVDEAGLAEMTAGLLTKGTASKSAAEIARAIESLGASLSASAGADATSVDLTTRADRAPDAFALMADLVRNPTFAEEEVDRQKRQTTDALAVAMTEPSSVARWALRKAVFGDGPYGGAPTARSIAAITRQSVAGYHAAHFRPETTSLVIVGDLSANEGFAFAQSLFGDWPRGAGPAGAPRKLDAARAPSIALVDIAGVGQAAVGFAAPAPARSAPDYFPTLVASNILGGGYSARLNNEIRIKRGLSYGARATYPANRGGSWYFASAQTRNDAAAEVARLMRSELAKLSGPAPAAEFAARKAVLIGGFESDLETRSGIAGQAGDAAALGLPMATLKDYAASVEAVTAEAAAAAAARYFDPAKASVVIVGDAATFAPAAVADYPDAARIDVKALDLD